METSIKIGDWYYSKESIDLVEIISITADSVKFKNITVDSGSCKWKYSKDVTTKMPITKFNSEYEKF